MLIVEELKRAVGPAGWATDAVDMAPHLVYRRGRYHGRAATLLSPVITSVEIALMQTLNRALDPHNILSPGKVTISQAPNL